MPRCEHCGLTAGDVAFWAVHDDLRDPICCLTADLPHPRKDPAHV